MSCEFLIGHVSEGVVVRLIGRGTMHESSAFQAAVEPNLQGGVVVFDATQCDYLDSTFLGCLVGIKKASAQRPNSRFIIAAPPQVRTALFSCSALHRYFEFVDECPQICDRFAAIEVPGLQARDLGRHVMRCHEGLAGVGGSEAPAFQAVADRLAKELGDSPDATH